MKKSRFILVIGVCASLFFAVPSPEAWGAASPQRPIGASSGVLVDAASGQVLWARDHAAVRAPASLTKILTALVVLDQAKLDDTATITPEARSVPGGRTFAEVGWAFSIEDLLWGLLLQSGNDAAVALAQKVGDQADGGGYSHFIELMNAKALEIGTKASAFKNPHGLDDVGHVSTASDLALISMYAMKNETFSRMVASKTHDVRWGDGNPHTYINHNKMLFRYPGAMGIKTGFTAGAGNSLSSAVTRDGTTLIAVVLGSPDHYADSAALYDWGFANLSELRGGSVERLTPNENPAEVPEKDKPLEIVEIDVARAAPQSSNQSGGTQQSYPLLAPLGALAAALAVALAIRRRQVRARAAFASVKEFRRGLEVLGSRSDTILPSPPAALVDTAPALQAAAHESDLILRSPET